MSRKNRAWKSRSVEYRARHTCRKKIPFENPWAAISQAVYYWLRGFKLAKEYQCEVCQKYHLSTRGKM